MAANKAQGKQFVWLGSLTILLLLSGWFLTLRLENIKKNNLKNKETLSEALWGFNNKSAGKLKEEIKNLKTEVANLANTFDPKEQWLKKDYDLSIYFVEELGKVNQFLKAKAAEKKVDFQELGFKEKLPSESEALYLLSQLYGLKEAVSLGLGYSVNFKSINPQGIEELGAIAGIKIAKSRIGLICPAQGLIEFIIQLNEIVPRPYTESFSLKLQGSSFEVDLAMDNILVDLDWKDKQEFVSLELKKELLSEKDQGFIRALRGANPFLVLAAKDAPSSGQEGQTEAKIEAPKAQQRFFYKGKANLRSKEVAVIEDALSQETVFLAQGEKIGNFVLAEISDGEIALKNTDDDKETIIKRIEE